MKYVSWSGGFDSTYLILKYIMAGETVQPFTLLFNDSLMSPIEKRRIKKTQDFFINLYSNKILKPEIFTVEDLQKRKSFSDILVYLNDYEKKIIKNHEIIYEEIYSANSLDIFFLKNSRDEEFVFKNYEKKYVEILYQHYWPVFHTNDDFFIKKKLLPGQECFSEYINRVQNYIIFPNIYLSNLFNVPIDLGFYSTITGTKAIEKWIGFDKDFKIKSDDYKELQITNNIRFPIAFLTKTDLVDDLLNIDIDLLELLIDNCCTCEQGHKHRNYCNRCISCRSMRRTKAQHHINLHKLKQNLSRNLKN